MIRRLFTLLQLLSLLLLVVVTTIWANSFSREDTFCWVTKAAWHSRGYDLIPFGNSVWALGTRDGQVLVAHHYPAVGAPAPGFRHEGSGYWDSDAGAKWFSFHMLRFSDRFTPEVLELTFPLPIVIALLAAFPASTWLHRRHKRRKPLIEPAPKCPSCGYNTTGNTSGICPECGRTVAAEAGT